MRVSLSCYNTHDDISRFVDVLKRVLHTLRPTSSSVEAAARQDKLEQKGKIDNTHNGASSVNTDALPIGSKIREARSWDEIYRQIMLAGKQLNKLPPEDQIGQYEVMGCESQVWLKCEKQGEHLVLAAHSSSKIVRGLLAIIFEPLAHLTLSEIKQFSLASYIQSLGLGKHVSQSRGNGLQAVIDEIQRQVR